MDSIKTKDNLLLLKQFVQFENCFLTTQNSINVMEHLSKYNNVK